MIDYDPDHYRFKRQADRPVRGERLVFEDSPPPLRPIIRLRWVVLAAIILAAALVRIA